LILRVVSGGIRSGTLDAVSQSFRRVFAPAAEATRGLRRYVVGTHGAEGGPRIAAMSIWDDLDAALAAYGGRLDVPRTLDGVDHGVAFDRVDYYELEAGRDVVDDRTPTRLRLTAGSVARGLGAEIQQELRARLPELPVEALEAYVGRRVLGSAVEIAFMSTWTAEPAGVRLDAPLWPGISERYDVFRLEVHEILLEGRGPAAEDRAGD
jgi:hypothetical protein